VVTSSHRNLSIAPDYVLEGYHEDAGDRGDLWIIFVLVEGAYFAPIFLILSYKDI
jgi:hypothetical protein